MVKSIVIYATRSGNTKVIAERLSHKLSSPLINLEDIKSEDILLDNYDTIFIGSGVYGNRFDEKIIKFLSEIDTKESRIFYLFSTWIGRGKSLERAISNCKEVLVHKNQSVSDTYFECFGNGFGIIKKGHPNQEDLLKLDKWVENINC